MKKMCLVLLALFIAVQLLAVPVMAYNMGDSLLSVAEESGNIFQCAIEFLLSGLKKLFVPRDDFFPKLADQIYEAFQAKFGNILSVTKVNILRRRGRTSQRIS